MYAILRTKKLKDKAKVDASFEHNLRIRTQANIDSTKKLENKILLNNLNIDNKKATDFREKMMSLYEDMKIKIKDDNVLAREFVATASPEFFKNKNPEQVDEWAKHQVDFMRAEFGEQMRFAILHMDEKTPHLHFVMTAERKEIRKFGNRHGVIEKEVWQMNSNWINPTFLRNLQTRFAEHNARYGLKRGEPGSDKRHISPLEYNRKIDKELYEAQRLSTEAEQEQDKAKKLSAEAERELHEAQKLSIEAGQERDEARKLSEEAKQEQDEARKLNAKAEQERNEAKRLSEEARQERDEAKRLSEEAEQERDEAKRLSEEAEQERDEAKKKNRMAHTLGGFFGEMKAKARDSFNGPSPEVLAKIEQAEREAEQARKRKEQLEKELEKQKQQHARQLQAMREEKQKLQNTVTNTTDDLERSNKEIARLRAQLEQQKPDNVPRITI